MNSQKRVTIAACAMFIMLGFLVGGISRSTEDNKEKNINKDDAPAISEIEIATDEELDYTLKIQDGVLVVFDEKDAFRPIIVTDIYAGTLRHFDRERLNEGITVSGEVEMQKLLEDFSS